MADLTGVWAKFNWGCEHHEAIEREFQRFLDGDPYSVTHQLEPDGWYRFRWSVRGGPPPLERFALLYGDAIYNLRAALDYIVWQLVLANNGTPTHEHAFPCVRDQKNWASAVGQRLKGVERCWIDQIGDLQPFNAALRGDDPKVHWLAILDYVNNVNKHRLPTAAVWKLSEFRHRIEFLKPSPEAQVPFNMPDLPIEDGAELASHLLPGVLGDDFNVYVDEAPLVQIAFPDGLNHTWLRTDLIAWVRDAIAVFEPAFRLAANPQGTADGRSSSGPWRTSACGFLSDPTARFPSTKPKSDPRGVVAPGGLDHGDSSSMDVPKVAPRSACTELAGLLDSPEIAELVRELEATRWTGRPGYPLRAMVGMALAKSMYAIPTWTRTVALVREHAGLQAALGCDGEPPSHWACYRFAAKLRAYKPLLDACIGRVLVRLHAEHPEMGQNVAIDGSDLPAYANGQRYVSKNGPEREKFSDPRRGATAPP